PERPHIWHISPGGAYEPARWPTYLPVAPLISGMVARLGALAPAYRYNHGRRGSRAAGSCGGPAAARRCFRAPGACGEAGLLGGRVSAGRGLLTDEAGGT